MFFSAKNKQKKLDNRKKEILEAVISVFPDDPYCLDGSWSWASQRVDIIFPELYLRDKITSRKVGVGLAVHCSSPKNEGEIKALYAACKTHGIPLLLLSLDEIPDKSQLIHRIETVFSGQLTVL